MPTYEYRCPEGHEFEKFVQKMSDARSELPCPTCGAVSGRRMSAGGGLLFKGSGFYITDYGKDGKKDQRAVTAKADAGAKSDAASTAAPAAPAAAPVAAAPAAKEPASTKSAPKSGPEK